MKKKLKLGVIGAGGIFRALHADAWMNHPEVELIAISDPIQQFAEETAKTYQIGKVYTNYHELLAQDDIDIVDICTPNVFHSEISIAALQAGKHVLCEKPDAINPEEAQKMADAAKRSGKTLLVMRNNRFTPANHFMKKYVEEGHMGEVYTGRCGWIRRRGIPGKGGWFTTKALSGGGPLIDLGVHFIDVAIWLMGNPKPISVVGAAYTKFADSEFSSLGYQAVTEEKAGTFDVEDLANGFIRFDNGATLQIEFSWASNIEKDTTFYELRGTQAGASFNNGELKLFTEIAGVSCDIHPKLKSPTLSDHAANIHHFVDVVQQRTKPSNTPEDGVHIIKILTAIYESARTGVEVRL